MAIVVNKKKCGGCALKCSAGMTPFPLINFPKGACNNNLPILTAKDVQVTLAIASFGICSHTGSACKPLVAFINGQENIYIDSEALITKEDTFSCMVGGTVGIV